VLFRTWDQPFDLEWPAVTDVNDHTGARHVVVTDHRLIRQVLADPLTYRPDNALDAMTAMPVSALRILSSYGFRLPATLANNGHPSHPGIREITYRALRPELVEAQRPWLTEFVARRVAWLGARLDGGEQVDLYAELAGDLPLLALARLVELPPVEVAVVKEFSRAALELFWAPVDVERQRELARMVGAFHAVLRDFVADAGGLVGELREHTRAEGLHRDTPIGALFFLLVAGQETTSQFLTLLLHRLAGEPAVLAGLRDGTVDVDDVVEEGLRLVPPIPTWRRVAATDTVLAGHPVPAGSSIVLWLARAGLQVVDEPAGFVPGQRGSRRHLAFGAGAHRCVGAQLSRMEAAVVIAQAADLLRGVSVVRAPWCPDNLSFRMPDAFVVARHPR
jgi:cytochrome P450